MVNNPWMPYRNWTLYGNAPYGTLSGWSTAQDIHDQVTVILPTLNEASAIGEVIDELKEYGYRKILVVDGGSHDLTRDIARKKNVDVMLQEGKGKSGAVKTGIDNATTPYLVVMDGDGTYPPEAIERMISASRDNDEVIAERMTTKKSMSRTHRIGNKLLSTFFNLLMGTNYSDVASGMYLLKRSSAVQMHIEDRGFAVDQEILAQARQTTAIPVLYRERIGKSKSTTWRQGFRALLTIFRLGKKFNPALLFSFFSSLMLIPFLICFSFAAFDYAAYGAYRSGIFIASLLFLILGAQGLTASTIAVILRRIEWRISRLRL